MTNPVLSVVAWYAAHKRDLPWRRVQDPYAVWLSEVILQQTRVDQGLAYYVRFLEAFPTVHHLAQASTDALMKQWEGLGYYSRARNLHATAKIVSEERNGEFPDSVEGLMKLKGIGPYTARAIASIAFGVPVGVVDGNVLRVISRYLGSFAPIDQQSTKQEIQNRLDAWIKPHHVSNPEVSSQFNQGLMDIGASVCTPTSPKCHVCPLHESCQALRDNSQALIPVKAQKLARKQVYYNFLLIQPHPGQIVVRRRPAIGVWGNLWEVPNLETDQGSFASAEFGGKPAVGLLKHVFTHMDMYIHVYRLADVPAEVAPEGLIVIPTASIKDYGFSRAVLKIFERHLLE